MPAPALLSNDTVPGWITLDSDLMAIRHGLARLLRMSPLCELNDDRRGTVEIVLAEVLNNVVEHAYAVHSGEIRVEVARCDAGLRCQIRDQGHPMPDGLPPTGSLNPMAAEDLPEGGFGWHLIRSLVRDLSYHREGFENVLTFHLDAF